jgi:hypothetical protein
MRGWLCSVNPPPSGDFSCYPQARSTGRAAALSLLGPVSDFRRLRHCYFRFPFIARSKELEETHIIPQGKSRPSARLRQAPKPNQAGSSLSARATRPNIADESHQIPIPTSSHPSVRAAPVCDLCVPLRQITPRIKIRRESPPAQWRRLWRAKRRRPADSLRP